MARIGSRSFRPASTSLTSSRPASHNPSKPAKSAEGTARSLTGNGRQKAPAAPEGHSLKRRNEGLVPGPQHRLNSPQVMGSANFPDVKQDGHIAGAKVDATHGLAGNGHVSSLAGSDASAPASYRNDMTERRGKSADQYIGAPGTKAETNHEYRSYHKQTQGSGDPGHNCPQRAFVTTRITST